MQILSEKRIIQYLEEQRTFTATVDTGAFFIRVNRYVPMLCTAVHAGHNLPRSLEKKILLSAEERRYEEDPFADEIISSFPITLQGLDSRYCYDLNRSPDRCIYEVAWNKKVWHRELSRKERKESLEKHASYYRVLDAVLSTLEKKFGHCIVYDVHAYNYQRRERNNPLFNIGTHCVDTVRYDPVLSHLKKQLHAIDLPNIDNRVGFNEVFQGKEEQASFIKRNHPDSLPINFAIKKVFMDELSGAPYPLILEELTEALKRALSYNAAYFARNYAGKRLQRSRFIASEDTAIIRRVDNALFKLARGIDTLLYVNPMNLLQEKKRFFAKGFHYNPQFVYRQLDIDPFVFRKNLYTIPVDDIQDVSIRQMYRGTIDMLATRIDLLTTIGSEDFLYNSLRYYGEPRQADARLARFFISAPLLEEAGSSDISAEQCAQEFREALKGYAFSCRIETSDRIVTRAMVNNTRKAILINKRARFSATEVKALINHELGMHMVTTMNADLQPLKIFKLGLPGNTETQEGLAILAEHRSGNLTLSRLKALAYRVIAVQMMVQDYDFSRTFKSLIEDYGLARDSAFTLTSRVYRGGGFTKDRLYLTGLQKVLQLRQSGQSLEPLLVGKTSADYLSTIKEMMEMEIVMKPRFSPAAWESPVAPEPILDYLLKAAL